MTGRDELRPAASAPEFESPVRGMPLPRSSWVPFTTRRLAAPQVVWTNTAAGFGVADAAEHACCMPLDSEPAQAYQSQERVQWADRYGGVGVGWCGGSARCGCIGEVQVKGSGRNPLFGAHPRRPADPWHSTGTLNAVDAAREAIWSVLCARALPHGAVPTLAVVLTGTQTPHPLADAGASDTVPRALALRRPALRPAHFLRNIYFGARPQAGSSGAQDALRTHQALAGLAARLAEAYPLAGGHGRHVLNDGLEALARRTAEQVAAALAKRIFHRALCCSNIALDGRYLDFGTTTANPAFRRVAGAPLPAGPDPWNQESALLVTLLSLRAHIARYLLCMPPSMASALLGEQALVEAFRSHHRRQMQIEFLQLTGLPRAAVERLEPPLRQRAFRCLIDVARRGARERFVWRNDDDPAVAGLAPLRTTGYHDLSGLLREAAACANTAALHARALHLLGDSALAHEFASVHGELIAWHLQRVAPTERAVADCAWRTSALRRNGDMSFLTREVLDQALASCGSDAATLGRLIDATLSKALPIVADTAPQ